MVSVSPSAPSGLVCALLAALAWSAHAARLPMSVKYNGGTSGVVRVCGVELAAGEVYRWPSPSGGGMEPDGCEDISMENFKARPAIGTLAGFIFHDALVGASAVGESERDGAGRNTDGVQPRITGAVRGSQ